MRRRDCGRRCWRGGWCHSGDGGPDCGGEMAEMHGCGFLGRRQIGHLDHIGRDCGSELGRHGLAGDLARVILPVVHRQDEGAKTPGRPVALVQKRLEHLVRRLHLAGYAERRGVAIGQFRVVGRVLERCLIIPLRARLIAGQVPRKPAIAEQGCFGIAKPGRLIEHSQRFGGVLRFQHDPAEACLHPAIVGLDHVGAREKTSGCARVVKVDRGLPCPDQRIDVARIGGKARKMAVQIFGAGRANSLHHPRLRLSSPRYKQARHDRYSRKFHTIPLANCCVNGQFTITKSAPDRLGRPTARS